MQGLIPVPAVLAREIKSYSLCECLRLLCFTDIAVIGAASLMKLRARQQLSQHWVGTVLQAGGISAAVSAASALLRLCHCYTALVVLNPSPHSGLSRCLPGQSTLLRTFLTPGDCRPQLPHRRMTPAACTARAGVP